MQISLLEAIEIIKSDSENLKRVMEYYGEVIKDNQVKCPFHNDKHPSMGLKGGRYKCFTMSCGASGDTIDFIRFKDGLDMLGAVKKALEVLGYNYTIEKNKLDKLKEYIEKEMAYWYKDKEYKLEDVHFYVDKENVPKLARIKYKNANTGKKQYSQANIVDGDYYKLDFKSNKINLIYNMHQVAKNITNKKEIFLVEGEKDADSLKRLGLCATTCREINSVDDEVLKPLQDARLVVLNDNDEAGKQHLCNIRKKLLNKVTSFKNPFIKEMYDLGEKADISDFINAKFEEGYTSKDIRKIIIDTVNRTLDEKNKNELQQDNIGIYFIHEKFDKEGELIDRCNIYLTNFNIISLTRVENIDTDEEMIELKMKSNLNEVKTIKGRSNRIFLDPKSFNSFMNMGFSFDGKPKDFTRFKNWVNKYFLVEKRNEYLITGIRDIDNKKMLITNTGALLKDGTIDTNYKANNHITSVDFTNKDRLTREQAIELSRHIFKFNSKKNCINTIGSLVANMFNSVYRETKGINVHVTSYVGESGSGKSFTIDNITRPLLNLDNDTLVFSGVMKHGLLRAMNDTYMPTIIDEVKPSQSSEMQRQILSNAIRSITGDSTVIKGTQNQGIKTYKYNSSLIIAGEEILDETALKNRCNIVWFSCNEMTDEAIENGSYFLSKEGKKALESLGLEIYLYIMNNFNPDKLLTVLEKIEDTYKGESKLHPRIQATFNNTMLGYITTKHILTSLGANTSDLECDQEASRLIYQNLKENVLDGEYATKQIYDDILEAIDELASGTGQYVIVEGTHYKQDSLYIKFDFKSIYPILESYYRSRGKNLTLDLKTFTGMIGKSKYVEGDSKQYYKVVNLDGKSRRCYLLKKENLNHLDMQTLNPNKIEWEEV